MSRMALFDGTRHSSARAVRECCVDIDADSGRPGFNQADGWIFAAMPQCVAAAHQWLFEHDDPRAVVFSAPAPGESQGPFVSMNP